LLHARNAVSRELAIRLAAHQRLSGHSGAQQGGQARPPPHAELFCVRRVRTTDAVGASWSFGFFGKFRPFLGELEPLGLAASSWAASARRRHLSADRQQAAGWLSGIGVASRRVRLLPKRPSLTVSQTCGCYEPRSRGNAIAS